jgi:hypothetical protein
MAEGSHDTNIIINDVLLSGIQNVSFQQNYNEDPVSLLGNPFATTLPTAPPTTTAKVDKFLLNKDIITGLTGSTGIFGSFVYGENILQFDGAVLDGYSLSVDLNSDPAISFDFTVYGDLSGVNPTLALNTVNSPIKAADVISAATSDNAIAEINQTGMLIELSSKEHPDPGADGTARIGKANAIQSFTFTETYQYQPKYKIGDIKPCQVDLIKPIEQSATVSIEVEDYSLGHKYGALPGKTNYSDLSTNIYRDKIVKITLKTKNGDENVFELQNAHLVSESISAGVGDTVVANLTYRGYKT